MIGVVDTSAIIRLFVPDGPVAEGLESFLLEVERGNAIALAPELMWAEAGNVLHKKHLRGELTQEEAEGLLDEIVALPIRPHSHASLLPSSFSLAQSQGMTIYDALFLALAESRGAVLFTADRQLHDAAHTMGLTLH